MPSTKETIWPIEPHTRTKHAILSSYLNAWFPILSTRRHYLFYVDGFAGPGKYLGGEDGSPIIAMNTARNHKLVDKFSNINFIFIEKDRARFAHLQEVIEPLKASLPPRFKVYTFHSEFDREINVLLDAFEESDLLLSAAFVFVDPFGYSGLPMKTMSRLMRIRACEVLITFSCDSVNRWLENPSREMNELDLLFACSDWRDAIELGEGKRIPFLVDLYVRQLHNIGGVRFVRHFGMINNTGHLVYALVFGTQSVEGLKHMKRAMWGADPTGRYRFSDRTDSKQHTLIEYSATPSYMSKLEALILRKFSGQQVNIEDIENYVWAETSYCFEHVKGKILTPLEKRGVIVIKSERKRKLTYPAGTLISFSSVTN